MGPRDMENGTIELGAPRHARKGDRSAGGARGAHRRADGRNPARTSIGKALDYRESMITRVDTWEEFKQVLDDKGGFVLAHWDGTVETEVAIKEATKATIRCIPIDAARRGGRMRLSPASRRTAACCSPAVISLRRARCRAIGWNIPGEYPTGDFSARYVGWCRPCGEFRDGVIRRKSDRRSCVSVNFTIFVHCRKNVRYVRMSARNPQKENIPCDLYRFRGQSPAERRDQTRGGYSGADSARHGRRRRTLVLRHGDRSWW